MHMCGWIRAILKWGEEVENRLFWRKHPYSVLFENTGGGRGCLLFSNCMVTTVLRIFVGIAILVFLMGLWSTNAAY